jgi:hypothetical protein
MSSKRRTFVKSRAEELKVLFLFVALGLLGGAWLLYNLSKLALLEMHILLP